MGARRLGALDWQLDAVTTAPQLSPPGGGQTTGGTLTVRVEGPFALQVQHVAPQLIERVNRILGHNAVARLKLVQGEVPRPPARVAPPPSGNTRPNLAPLTEAALTGVKDEGLRAALEDLAAQLAASGGPPKIG